MSQRHLSGFLSPGCTPHEGTFATPWHPQNPMQCLAWWLMKGWSSKTKTDAFPLETFHLSAALSVTNVAIIVARLILHLPPSDILLVNKSYAFHPSNISQIHSPLLQLQPALDESLSALCATLLLPDLKPSVVLFRLQHKSRLLSFTFKVHHWPPSSFCLYHPFLLCMSLVPAELVSPP